jgi:hypothetical protein
MDMELAAIKAAKVDAQPEILRIVQENDVLQEQIKELNDKQVGTVCTRFTSSTLSTTAPPSPLFPSRNKRSAFPRQRSQLRNTGTCCIVLCHTVVVCL